MASVKNSRDITRAELVRMIARLRGALYGVLAGEADKDAIRELLGQTIFDCDGDSFDAPEPSASNTGIVPQGDSE